MKKTKSKDLKCCVTTCKNNATNLLGSNTLKGSIPFCKDCLMAFDKHSMAREQHFKEDGQEEILIQVGKIIDSRIRNHKRCDKIDNYEEQHMEHSVILAELNFIKSKLKKL